MEEFLARPVLSALTLTNHTTMRRFEMNLEMRVRDPMSLPKRSCLQTVVSRFPTKDPSTFRTNIDQGTLTAVDTRYELGPNGKRRSVPNLNVQGGSTISQAFS